MSRTFSISSQDTVLNIIQCKNITGNNIRRVPKESEAIHEVRWNASSNLNHGVFKSGVMLQVGLGYSYLAMDNKRIINIDEKRYSAIFG